MGDPAVDSSVGGGAPLAAREVALARSAPALPGRWRLLVSPPLAGAENMALDEALMARARTTSECVLRAYAWRRPTLSFGRNQTARGEYDADRARALGVDVVRRPTGGRAVLHWREVTYSVTAPADVLGELRHSYLFINRLLLQALRALGAEVAMASAGRAPAPGLAPCFETPVSGEIVARGRKLVGSAQWRDEGVLLQHGSILVEDDQALATALLTRPAPPSRPPATLRDLLGRSPSVAEVADAIGRTLGAGGATVLPPLAPDAALAGVTRSMLDRYRSDDWTWRR
jgi:lipoate-protein ligase A